MKQLNELDRNELLDVIKSRRSVRTFDGNGLAAEEIAALQEFADRTENPASHFATSCG
ncbi:MAG: hypothetical protein IKN28_03270 [Firmicutes bacterium]|nr:hypothetical protein [Bacillota bacterium]MBR3748870.1 hypothetical protein [Bacillota bacterium]